MGYDLLVRGGWVIDPANGRQGVHDVAVTNGRIAAVARDLPADQAGSVVDAQGQYVTPGLIDMHTHCYWGATYWGIEADPVAARSGVTTWLDVGSAGAYTFPGFRRYVAEANRARVLSLLNISAIGLVANSYELANPHYLDVELGATIVEDNRDLILGIKVRMDGNTTLGTGLQGLQAARRLADLVQLPLMVHIGMAPPALPEITALMRPGDILTHCCTGQDNRVVDDAGRPYPYIRELWERGVVLDVGHGTGSFSYASAEAMLAAGVVPDVISSDIHQLAVLGPMYDLPTTISKFLNLGMSLFDAIERATIRPARAMGRPDLGTLSVGAPADLALFQLEEGDYTFYDVLMRPRRGRMRLVNTATYAGGALLPHREERPPAPWVARDLPPVQRSAPRPGPGMAMQGVPSS
ncbi:MAG TPA: amidohydrolase/deacetylase family metallohydrolase [Chloroflexota bacterium]|jgi:dihydroorotase|nr:amidohydrolase/deacetylase family metallohydrolase [Chloroflexota bacterium]